ncbi:lipopolysaccharide assembly protein LapB [Nitrosomonas communis]|uniref:tetratricopeptide repeat protein n=1 Tax=Nitrosomonas communis TaxID=44574 RepID=UPI0026ED4091|nr:tetratricopeptide repeat protein [Nitrosomonas communis]MCO6427644.1 tetratricopeptide repeat protein [Nitrosomonas communis]
MKFVTIKHAVMILTAIMLAGMAQFSWAKEKKPESTDFIELAVLMLKDGHYDRALMALQSVDLDDEKTDLARFYTLQGLAYMNLNEFDAAKDSLQSAIKHGQQDPLIYVYLAQIYFSLKNYQDVLRVIDKTGEHKEKNPSLLFIQAQSYWHLQKTNGAINTLNEGHRRFPGDFRFLKLKVFYFVQLELYQEAAKLGQEYLALSKAKAEDYVAIGNALRLSKEYQEAMKIMEIARLQFPGNEVVAKLLAHIYLDQGKLNAAAHILEQAARLNHALLSEAAEIYRRAGRLHKALMLNSGISDQKVKLKQRLSILLALKQFEQAASMESSLYRVGLLEDQNVRYPLAYALFSTGRFQQVGKHLDSLKEPELFKKGIELRRLIEACKDEPWECA